MRFCLTLLFFAVNSIIWAQFSDDFEDGDFSTAPAWSGQTSNFIVNGSNELQLNAPAVTDTSYLSVATTSINNVTWDFYVRMEFNPSSSNLTRVYLVSDNANLKGTLNGYFVMLGGTSDEISLYRQNGTAITEIIDGLDGSLNSDPCEARVRITRDGAGNWELTRDTTGGYNFFSEGTVLDANFTATTNFGVVCKYTSTRSTSFFFDNLGDPYIDATPPAIDTTLAISASAVDVYFSEPLNQITAETGANYSLSSLGSPSSVVLDGGDPTLVHLTFVGNMTNGSTYQLTVNNVQDAIGNSIVSPTVVDVIYFVADIPVAQDVIITEFIADPSPQVGLPEVEYVEIYNRSTKTFDLSGWTLSDASSAATFGSYVLLPDSYLLICGTGDCGQFFVPNSTEISLPSLNNDQDAIVIKDDLGNVIDSLYFSLSWYNDQVKEGGGWSLERKHNNSPCSGASNWGASVDAIGGTPGAQNSIWTDQDDVTPPFISGFEVVSDTELSITFNENMDTTGTISGSITPSVSSWSALAWFDPLTIGVSVNTIQPNVLYAFDVSAASDCWGNVMNTQTIYFGIPDSIEAEDLILNEVMFNPLTGGSDYVEIYNNSDKILDLADLLLANWDDSIANFKSLITQQKLILPQSYVLIAEDTNAVINDFSIYGVGTMIEADMPTYPNDSGTVYLLTKDYELVDYFHYDEEYHFELLTSADGKSLERIQFGGGMNNPDNWHTAAENVEWGTPGYENSQLFIPNPTGNASVDPQLFSPDNDGYNDVVTINLNLQSTENVVDIEIFDNRGRLIRLLKDNFFVGNGATFTWDGINDKGEKAAIGSYIILVSVGDQNGDQTQYKLVTVLAGNL